MKNKIIDQPNVGMPPIIPWIIDNKSLKTSVLNKRSILANLINRINRKSDAEGRSPEVSSAAPANVRQSCMMSRITRNESKQLDVFNALSDSPKYPLTPFIAIFATKSLRNKAEKMTSITNQTPVPVDMSMLKPMNTALTQITAPMIESMSVSTLFMVIARHLSFQNWSTFCFAAAFSNSLCSSSSASRKRSINEVFSWAMLPTEAMLTEGRGLSWLRARSSAPPGLNGDSSPCCMIQVSGTLVMLDGGFLSSPQPMTSADGGGPSFMQARWALIKSLVLKFAADPASAAPAAMRSRTS
mmetsp:Transcript_118871/g.343802  ORF Transcript_118871/g.343802 Transcript_118871/m.343802 type:complete len:299 (+) Transcript_118871:683-1579(+)